MTDKLRFERPDPADEPDPAMPALILVPGFRDTPRVLRRLASRLCKLGVAPHVVSPQPSAGQVGIDALAEQLAGYVEQTFAPERPLTFFGFSMGGLVCRYYVQRLGGAARTRRLITLATPHYGTYMAYAYPQRPACVQMRPGSPFLVDLNQDFAALDGIEIISLWTPADLTIMPATSSCLPTLETRMVISPVHGLLLFDPLVVGQVAGLLTAAAGETNQTAPVSAGQDASQIEGKDVR